MKKYDYDMVFNYAMYYRNLPASNGGRWLGPQLIDDLFRCRMNGEKHISPKEMTDDEFFEFANEVAATYDVLEAQK
ncbi:MAG: hypothetical protein IKA00_11220 [Prevotella sp.]|nr:hypothetical protein [Prevotella sp.]